MNDSSLARAGLVAMPTSNDRLAAIVAHAGTWFGWFLVPLCVYLIKRGDSRWVEFQSLQALLWSVFGTIVSVVTCGLAIPVFLAFHLWAAFRVYRGEDYEYPVAGDLARGLLAGSRPV